MTAFYNEIDPYCAQWLRNLIAAGHIAPGVVDERSIEDITPNELREYTQCHFFAGIGVWSYALRLAGWPDDRPVWTGSCPCQPFSAAGKGHGFADERHLWPAWFHLIRECRPGVVFGEQVASRDGLGWLDLVQADLEGADYASGAVDLCAAGVGAPHIRQRLWFVADPVRAKRGPLAEGRGHVVNRADAGWQEAAGRSGMDREVDGLAHANLITGGQGCAIDRRRNHGGDAQQGAGPRGGGVPLALAHASRPGSPEQRGQQDEPARLATASFWSYADWVACRDGKSRPIEPGVAPLVDGAPNRVGRLRAYGNAINAEAAAAVIRAYMQARQAELAMEAA